jgi:spore germination protein YaaH
MVRTTIDTTDWSSDESGTVTETYKPACMDGDSLYLALDFVRQYTNFSYETYTDPNRLVLHTADESKTSASVTKDTAIRTTGGVKSNIMKDLTQGDTVYILQEMTDWSEVESTDGIIGYVENKFLENRQNVTISVPQDYTGPEFTSAKLDEKVNMGWNNVISTAGNTSFDEVTQNTKALNVISPTWYPVSDDEGHIDSYATQDYVDKAHAMGLRVWPVVDNFNNTDIDSSKFLGTLETRSNVISSLMTEAETYGFDGINVDFEQIDVNYSSDFIEFIRELSIQCRKRSLTLSVDNYVTYDFNDYYSMDEQAVFADYIVIMGYDEHYAGSSEAGSVASIDYIKYGIQRAMQEVPAEKIINGIPFYTRLWKTDSSGLSSEALSMSQAQDFITNHGAEVTWDSTTCQNIIDFTENDVHYQMWVEDSESISAKLDVMTADGIAGVAEWRLGFETADVWDVIEQYINGTLNMAQ